MKYHTAHPGGGKQDRPHPASCGQDRFPHRSPHAASPSATGNGFTAANQYSQGDPMWSTRERSVAKPLDPKCTHRPAGAPPRLQMPCESARGSALLPVGALAVGMLLHALSAQAVEFGSGELQGSFDTTLSHGLTFRVADRDQDLVTGASAVNDNDGNLNYDKGLVSNTSKFTSDLELNWADFGAFVRASGFHDFENENGSRERTPLSEEAKDLVGKDVELLDAYVTGAFETGAAGLDVRLGRHVLNWGESTFIQNGVNSFNAFDVNRLRTPGAELREALEPVTMASFAASPTDAVTLEGFYQFDWEKTEIDPTGSYFSTVDYVGAGGERAVIPVSDAVTDEGFGFGPLLTPAINADLMVLGDTQPQFDSDFVNVARGADREPGDSGQWGVALRYLAQGLNDTEFGFYFVNHHSRLPLAGATTGDRTGIQAGLFAAQAVSAPTSETTTAVTSAVTDAVTRQITAQVTAQAPAGTPPEAIQALVADEIAKPETRQSIGAEVESQVSSIVSALAIDRYVETGEYFVEYPEDIRILGLSFNTQLGATGWALQGEYSLRRDAPLQRTEDSLFAEGLAPILRTLDPSRPDYIQRDDVSAYLASYRPSKVQGYVRRDISQLQATATKVFGPALGADGGAFVAEVAVSHVHGMPDKDVTPLESPAIGENSEADATSWGYRLAARLDHHNAVGAVNLFPYVQFQHDVSGDSPSPGGPFVEDRTALTLGLRADYLSRWEAGIGYTRYAGDRNELRDRDFISTSIKYSF